MKIVEVTVGELADFINSPEYHRLDVKPITPLRAVSQSKNPNASASDLALIYACDNHTLLSLAGLLPASLYHKNGFVFSNSGWWVNPQNGKALGLPMFLRAFNACKRRMVLTDCTAYTKEILDKTGYFKFLPPLVGKRWFMRFYFGARLKNNGYKKHTVNFVSGIDSLLNTLSKPLLPSGKKDVLPDGYEIIQCRKLNSDYIAFIEKHSGQFFLRQDIEKLNWIISNPWVTDQADADTINYPFSYKVQSFRQHFLVIRNEGEIRAVVMISMRDNHITLPFYYGSSHWINEVAGILKQHIINLKASSLILYNGDLLRAFDTIKIPAYFTTNVVRYVGYSNELEPFFPADGFFQDGEADVVFT